MNTPARMILVLGCLILAAIELPRGAELFVDDLDGPYGPSAAQPRTNAVAQPRVAATDAPRIGAPSSHDGWDEVSVLGRASGAQSDDRSDATLSFDDAPLAGR